jgi:hypothetical protein
MRAVLEAILPPNMPMQPDSFTREIVGFLTVCVVRLGGAEAQAVGPLINAHPTQTSDCGKLQTTRSAR